MFFIIIGLNYSIIDNILTRSIDIPLGLIEKSRNSIMTILN